MRERVTANVMFPLSRVYQSKKD